MRLTVLGCSGSVCGPESAASGYLLEDASGDPVVVDCGPGTVGELQKVIDPNSVHVALTHLHADHCLDVPGLIVWRRYGPCPGAPKVNLIGPTATAERIGMASWDREELDDITDTFDVFTWTAGVSVGIGAFTMTPSRAWHPPEAYCLRIQAGSGKTLFYTGDTALCDDVVAAAQGADVLLCEASWEHAPGQRPEGIHMSGTEAGELATQAGVGRLLLTHCPPWTDADAVLAEAARAFDGDVEAVRAGAKYEF